MAAMRIDDICSQDLLRGSRKNPPLQIARHLQAMEGVGLNALQPGIRYKQ
jgi:hypothetical protein